MIIYVYHDIQRERERYDLRWFGMICDDLGVRIVHDTPNSIKPFPLFPLSLFSTREILFTCVYIWFWRCDKLARQLASQLVLELNSGEYRSSYCLLELRCWCCTALYFTDGHTKRRQGKLSWAGLEIQFHHSIRILHKLSWLHVFVTGRCFVRKALSRTWLILGYCDTIAICLDPCRYLKLRRILVAGFTALRFLIVVAYASYPCESSTWKRLSRSHLFENCAVEECILDGLKWETIKSAGSLLCELFRSNPNYQEPGAGLWRM